VQDFVDMMLLASLLPPGALAVVNLPGSGASVPQHFHCQLILADDPSHAWAHAMLRQNVRVGGQIARVAGVEVDVSEIATPMWGLRLGFPPQASPASIGKAVYRAVHSARLRSQLRLSYNLLIPRQGEVLAIFRAAINECPFLLAEVLSLVRSTAGDEARDRVSASANARWRWGWLECVGGLPTRDASLASPAFGSDFWLAVYECLSLAPGYRSAVVAQVINSLQVYMKDFGI
jgi:hypothetical protein